MPTHIPTQTVLAGDPGAGGMAGPDQEGAQEHRAEAEAADTTNNTTEAQQAPEQEGDKHTVFIRSDFGGELFCFIRAFFQENQGQQQHPESLPHGSRLRQPPLDS